jgi:hypothetical protein
MLSFVLHLLCVHAQQLVTAGLMTHACVPFCYADRERERELAEHRPAAERLG